MARCIIYFFPLICSMTMSSAKLANRTGLDSLTKCLFSYYICPLFTQRVSIYVMNNTTRKQFMFSVQHKYLYYSHENVLSVVTLYMSSSWLEGLLSLETKNIPVHYNLVTLLRAVDTGHIQNSECQTVKFL